MNKTQYILMVRFVAFTVVGAIGLSGIAVRAEKQNTNYSVWVGSHISTFDSYSKKVGEYSRLADELLPAFWLSYSSYGLKGFYDFRGYYFDKENALGKGEAKIGTRLKTNFLYRSQTRQLGQDLLSNLEAREWLGTKPGGKILTHELTDSGADYNYTRREIQTGLDYLISNKNNVKVMVAHRSIFEDGNEQSISSNHCFSCHVTSEGVEVERESHQIKAGLQAEFNKLVAGYSFTYRQSKSNTTTPTVFYDAAKHPVTGGAVDEFGSRVIYDDTVQAYSSIPKIEKFSHKICLKKNICKRRLRHHFFLSHTVVVSSKPALGVGNVSKT